MTLLPRFAPALAENKALSGILAGILFLLPLSVFTPNADADPAEGDLTIQQALAYKVKLSPSYTISRRFSGTVNARQRADLGFEQGGKVARILAHEGQAVAKGQLLAELDTELLLLEEKELTAHKQEIEAQLALVNSSLTRQQRLKSSGYTSEQRLDELNSEKSSQEAALRRLDANLKGVSARLEKSRLLAPFAGTISHRFADEGTVLNPGTALLRLQQEGVMEAHIGIPFSIANSIEPQETLTVLINNQAYDARVMSIGSNIHPQTRTVPVRLALPDDTLALQGELATLEIQEKIKAQGTWLPITAVTDGIRGLWTVYLLKPDDTDATYKLVSRAIQITHGTANEVFVQGSLREGDLVVATGLQRFAPGQRVRISLAAEE